MSRFATIRSEEDRLDSLADPSSLGDLNEDDPKSVARWMKKMGSEMGEDLGDDVEEALEEETGEDLGSSAEAAGEVAGGATTSDRRRAEPPRGLPRPNRGHMRAAERAVWPRAGPAPAADRRRADR